MLNAPHTVSAPGRTAPARPMRVNRRLAWVLCLFGCLMMTACSSSKKASGPGGWTRSGDRDASAGVPAGWQQGTDDEAAIAEDDGTPVISPSATSDVVMLRAQVYEAMGQMSRAGAGGDTDRMEASLDEAMDGIRQLARWPGALEDAEGRELYRSVITAYEQYYGVTDTLRTEYGEIFAFRAQLFSTMNDMSEPLLEDVALPAVRTPAFTVPMTQNRLVEQSTRFLLKSPERHLNHWRSRAATYFPMVEQILREEGVPDELKYLAMIESALNPRARSHASAVGMWQFMQATGAAYGLKVTHWVDERMDPEKSTRAAARHLKDLYKQFGDWHLALAAYNSGGGRVTRALRRIGAQPRSGATFWDVYEHLPRETRNYVPMYIAAAMVVSNPEAFNAPSVQPGPRYAYDVAAIEGMLDLQTVASLAATDVETIRALNPELRQMTTPPSRTPYQIRLPLGSHQRFAEGYAALPAERRQSITAYQVRRGDTLSKIARRHGTTTAALMDVNSLRSTRIQVGQTLQVPIQHDNYGGAAVAGGGGQSVQYNGATPVRRASYTGDTASGSTVTPAPAASASASTAANRTDQNSTRVRYRVRRGDNLSKIARQYGVSVADVKGWNDLSNDRIRSGQTLTLYPGSGSSSSAGTARTTHRVQRGESLFRIAQRYSVTVGDLRRWNSLKTDTLQPGQTLVIHAAATAATASNAGSSKRWITHKVKRGENLTTIARKYGATVADVKRWNSLRTDTLRSGQRLAVYTR